MKNRHTPSSSDRSNGAGTSSGTEVREDITVVFRSDAIHPGEFEKDILHLFSHPETGKLPALQDVCTRQEENGLTSYSFITRGIPEPGESTSMAQRTLHKQLGAKILTIARKYDALSYDNNNTPQFKM